MMNPGNVRPQPGEDPNVLPVPGGPEIVVPGWTDEPSGLPSTDPEAPNGVPKDPDDDPEAPPDAPDEDPEKDDPDKDDGPDKDPDEEEDPNRKDGEPDTEEGDPGEEEDPNQEEEPGEEPDDLGDRKLTVVADFPLECPLRKAEAPSQIPREWSLPDKRAA